MTSGETIVIVWPWNETKLSKTSIMACAVDAESPREDSVKITHQGHNLPGLET